MWMSGFQTALQNKSLLQIFSDVNSQWKLHLFSDLWLVSTCFFIFHFIKFLKKNYIYIYISSTCSETDLFDLCLTLLYNHKNIFPEGIFSFFSSFFTHTIMPRLLTSGWPFRSTCCSWSSSRSVTLYCPVTPVRRLG